MMPTDDSYRLGRQRSRNAQKPRPAKRVMSAKKMIAVAVILAIVLTIPVRTYRCDVNLGAHCSGIIELRTSLSEKASKDIDSTILGWPLNGFKNCSHLGLLRRPTIIALQRC